MYDYNCIDSLGNELIIVHYSMIEARKQAIKRFKKKFNSELISCKADYSKNVLI
jgi:hypothetical protein